MKAGRKTMTNPRREEVIPIKFFERFRRDWDFRHAVIQTATIVVLILTCIVQIVGLVLCS